MCIRDSSYGGLTGTVSLQSCQFYSGIFTNGGPTALITNCLFERVAVSLATQAGLNAASDSFNNNRCV